MAKFNIQYFILAILLFALECFIAKYVHDGFVRPFFGDFLVVILMYCFIKSFFNFSVLKTAFFVLAIAFCIEALQYLNFVKTIGQEQSKTLKTVLGNSFSWSDILCYIAGIFAVIAAEYLIRKQKLPQA